MPSGLKHNHTRALWPYALLAAFVFLFFWDSFLAGKAPVMRDTVIDFLPWRMFAREAFRAGALPLWNPYSNCGQPFMAEPQSAFFYAPHALFYAFPPVTALKLWLALHYAIAAVSMYALARHWRLQAAPALMAAIGFAFGTHLIAAMEFQSLLGALVWTPLTLLLTSRLVEAWSGSRQTSPRVAAGRMIPAMLILAVVLATQYLAGHQQAFLNGALINVLFLMTACVARRDLKGLAICGAAWGAAGALALGLSMTQFLLTLQLVPESVRAMDFDPRLDQGSLHPRLLLAWLVPYFAGAPGQWAGARPFSTFEFWVGTAYIGAAPLVLATLSLARLRRGGRTAAVTWLLWAIVAFGIVMSMGKYTPVYMWCHRHLPLIDKFRWPSKFLQLAAFALPLLGAIGMQGLLEGGGRAERRLRAAIVAGWIALWGAMALAWLMRRDSPEFFARLGGLDYSANPNLFACARADFARAAVFLGIALAASVFMLAERIPARWRRGAGLAIVLVTFVNLGDGRRIQPLMPDAVYRFEPPALNRFKDEADPGRCFLNMADKMYEMYGVEDPRIFVLARKSGIGESWLPYHVYKVWGTSTLVRADYNQLLSALMLASPADPGWQRVANLVNTRHLVVAPSMRKALEGKAAMDIELYGNNQALPRAMVVDHWMTAPRGEAMELLMRPDFDIYRQIVVDRAPAGWPANHPLAAAGRLEPITRLRDAGVDAIRYGWNRVDVTARSAGRALLFLDDVHDAGWRAEVDGREVPILRANMCFRAVPLEAGGPHTVSFRYWPRQATLGLAATAATMVMMIMLAAIAWRIRSKGNQE
ncbi:MAG: YfhO family protein [Candidatus Sumerlaeia bacterium]